MSTSAAENQSVAALGLTVTDETLTVELSERICFAVVGIGFPLMVGLLTFLVAQSFSISSKVDRLSDQIAATRNDYVRLADRLDRLERPGGRP